MKLNGCWATDLLLKWRSAIFIRCNLSRINAFYELVDRRKHSSTFDHPWLLQWHIPTAMHVHRKMSTGDYQATRNLYMFALNAVIFGELCPCYIPVAEYRLKLNGRSHTVHVICCALATERNLSAHLHQLHIKKVDNVNGDVFNHLRSAKLWTSWK